MNQSMMYATLAKEIASIPNPEDHSDFDVETALETYTALKFIIGQCGVHMDRMARIEQATKAYVDLIKAPSNTLEWQMKAMTELKALVKTYEENKGNY